MIDPQAYSHEDFVQNPGKYVLFRTARIAEAIVNIRYFATQLNKVRGNVNMPVYQVWVDNHEDLKVSPTMVYACALGGFLL